jgi:hypothetical protein
MSNTRWSQSAILILLSCTAALAAPVTLPDPSTTKTASVDYSIFVNNGGNQSSATYLGTDPANLTHTAFNVSVNDGEVLSLATLDLSLSSSGNPTGTRSAPYFVGVPASATYNPTFTAARLPQYTVSVSSSFGTNSYTGSGSVAGLDVLSLTNFATLLDETNTGRTITVTWHDLVDFTLPTSMPKNALPGATGGGKEYRWAVSAALTGQGQFTYESAAATPEPASMLLIGSSLLALSAFSGKLRKRLARTGS